METALVEAVRVPFFVGTKQVHFIHCIDSYTGIGRHKLPPHYPHIPSLT